MLILNVISIAVIVPGAWVLWKIDGLMQQRKRVNTNNKEE